MRVTVSVVQNELNVGFEAEKGHSEEGRVSTSTVMKSEVEQDRNKIPGSPLRYRRASGTELSKDGEIL